MQHIQSRLAGLLNVAPEKITADLSFPELVEDSFDAVELVMTLEEDFDIHIPDDRAESIATIGDAIRYIEGQMADEELR